MIALPVGLRARLSLMAGVLLVAASGAAAAAECSNFYGDKCRVTLSTGVQMSYIDTGPQTGQPVILLHGYTDSSFAWAGTAGALGRLNPGLRLIAVDQRGGGGGTTDLPETDMCAATPARCMTTAERAADVIALIRALRLSHVVIVGHSMGSVVARTVALSDPAAVAKIVLVGTPDERPAGLVGLAGITAFQTGVAGGPGPLDPTQWRKALEAHGVSWPRGAFNLRLIDLDPDAVHDLLRYWDVSAIAPYETLAGIATRTSQVRLKYWGIDPSPVTEVAEHLERLSVPVLVLWGTQDALMSKTTQDRLIQTLRRASRANEAMYFVWKQYGVLPVPQTGQQTDIAHEIDSEAPSQLATDIDSFIRTGKPTNDLFHTDYPNDLHTIVTERGKALVVASRLVGEAASVADSGRR